jgi:DNA-binding transcriptional MerR regulator
VWPHGRSFGVPAAWPNNKAHYHALQPIAPLRYAGYDLVIDPVPQYRVQNGGMRTGELANQAAVNVQTIRFYERERLLAPPPRTAAGYRCYSRQDLERVVFIKTCQQLGFSLKDIRALAALHERLAAADARRGTAERRKIAAIARDRLRQIDGKLHQLTEMRAHLQALCDDALEDREPRCPAASLKKSS